jgi:hypothetical protein
MTRTFRLWLLDFDLTGDYGPVHHQHVTATDDIVNVASRLLEVASSKAPGSF